MSAADSPISESTLRSLVDRVERLESELQEEREQRQELEQEVHDLEDELQTQTALNEALRRKIKVNENRVAELQSRSLETGAHLHAENVDPDNEHLFTSAGQLERITKEDGDAYLRLPGEEDALGRGGAVAHSTTDLLPLQRLARYDDEMLAKVTNSEPTELAARAWRERDDAGRYALWSKGGAGVRVYVSTSDLAEWIRSRKAGVSKKYSQELARRTKDALLDLAQGRLAAKKKSRKKDGLSYAEWRVILPDDVDLPGEISPGEDDSPATTEAVGE